MRLQTANQTPSTDRDTTSVWFAFLRLMDAAVVRARSDALSKNDVTRRRAIEWLIDMDLSIKGPTRQCRLDYNKADKPAERRAK